MVGSEEEEGMDPLCIYSLYVGFRLYSEVRRELKEANLFSFFLKIY